MSTTTMGPTAERVLRQMAFRGGDSLATTAEVRGITYTMGAGSTFLHRVRDGVLETALRTADRGSLDVEPDADDRDEVIGQAPHDVAEVRWQEFTELYAWGEDIAELGGGGGDITETVAGAALQVIAARLFDRLWGEVREAARRDEEA